MKIKFAFLPDWIKNLYMKALSPIIDFFIKRRLNPNYLTTIGLTISLLAAYLFGTGFIRTAGIIMLIAGMFDNIDGEVARLTKRVTKFGALYDSTLDRYAEVTIFFGLAYYFVNNPWVLDNFHFPIIDITVDTINLSIIISVAVCMALGGSVMTSYVKARAEGLDLECKVGVMQRPERVVFLAFGAIFHKVILAIAIIIIAIFSNYTAIQRLHHVWMTEEVKRKELVNE